MNFSLKPFVLFVLSLLAVWAGFVVIVIIFKNKIKNRKDSRNDNYDDFESRYKNLDETIERKKQESKEE
ncbi:MAG: hypothetical protein GF375_01845 [Candidatus Omnitrophica bacterium]|nr:hypothetical protein [Candidatus Omnitrophota bacterium]MBD3268868.1 hypothetical protein [Candidatus Omnitrophota bacterium]